jgi:penicillin-binding protein 1C
MTFSEGLAKLKSWFKPNKKRLWIALLLACAFYVTFPEKLFNEPKSTIVLDAQGDLLSAKIASDGQWRFPDADSIPASLEAAILEFEDAYFYFHPGINPVSMTRALWHNITGGKIVSGGSTISMQVIRLSRKGQARTYFEKLIEVYLALRMEFSYSKEEILRLYVSNAPYGGNVVGVEAASWRYFSRPLHQLSWAEVSLLAVLPNAPSLMHPGRNRDALVQKRNRLLNKLKTQGYLDEIGYSLATMETLPDAPNPLPSNAFHLLDFAVKSGKEGQRLYATIDAHLQNALTEKLDRYVRFLAQNEVHNACAMIVSLKTGEVKAYVGNSMINEARSPYVDIIQAPRSSGSILKPFLYGLAFEKGLLHPNTFVRDVPISIGRYAPENFDKSFQGVLPAKEALAKSLNIPATLLLQDYGLPVFYEDLQHLGFSTIHRPVNNYGLTLILGGAEVSLWDLARIYTQQALALKSSVGQLYDSVGFSLWKGEVEEPSQRNIAPGAWWQVAEALTDVQRPDLNKDWKRFSSSRKIAWKTGTSHGFRDAWAVGFDGSHLVAVWVGNADGEGRPGLTGTSTAAPLMFEAFQLLPKGDWFYKPDGNLKYTTLCAVTGMAASQFCPKDSVEIPTEAKHPSLCENHSLAVLNERNERVFYDCANGPTHDSILFNLDPVAAYFYAFKHPNYRPLPPFSSSCSDKQDQRQLAVIYPETGSEIIIPKNLSGQFEEVVLQATHVDSEASLFWHVDDRFVGQTTGNHQLSVQLESGAHILMITDEHGNTEKSAFQVYK